MLMIIVISGILVILMFVDTSLRRTVLLYLSILYLVLTGCIMLYNHDYNPETKYVREVCAKLNVECPDYWLYSNYMFKISGECLLAIEDGVDVELPVYDGYSFMNKSFYRAYQLQKQIVTEGEPTKSYLTMAFIDMQSSMLNEYNHIALASFICRVLVVTAMCYILSTVIATGFKPLLAKGRKHGLQTKHRKQVYKRR